MAAPDMTVSRLGQVNGAGDVDAIFLTVAAGEVLTAFTRKNVTLDKHKVRTISEGKSARFPFIGKASASYHTPGTYIVGQAINHAQKTIAIDDVLIADTFIAEIDEAKNDYEVRAPYTKELGEALATSWDVNVLRKALQGADSAAVISGGNGGSDLVNTAYDTDSSILAGGLFDAAQKFQEKDQDHREASCFLLPAQYFLLAQNTDVINKDWGGEGAYNDGTVVRIAGIPLVMTNNLPTGNVTTGPTTYQDDYSNTVAAIFRPEGVATVKLLDMAMESEWLINNQGQLLLAKYAVGTDSLRPDANIRLGTVAMTP